MTFGIGRKIEFSNWNFKLRVNYSFALTFIFYSAHAVHRRLAAGAATGHPTRRAPGQTCPPRPWFRRNQPPWHLPRATRRRTSLSRRRRSRRPSHASPRHCPRRRSSCPPRFMTPIPSSPLPLLALELELELFPALERCRRPPWSPVLPELRGVPSPPYPDPI